MLLAWVEHFFRRILGFICDLYRDFTSKNWEIHPLCGPLEQTRNWQGLWFRTAVQGRSGTSQRSSGNGTKVCTKQAIWSRTSCPVAGVRCQCRSLRSCTVFYPLLSVTRFCGNANVSRIVWTLKHGRPRSSKKQTYKRPSTFWKQKFKQEDKLIRVKRIEATGLATYNMNILFQVIYIML